jgi:pescadillo protein
MLLPPHLSPFVDDNKEGYLPKYREELKNLTDSDNGTTNNGKQRKEIIDDDDADDEAEYERHILANRSKSQRIVGDAEGSNNKPDEVKGKADKGPKALVHVPAIQKMTEDEEASKLSQIMMTKKTKRLYGRMQHGIQKKQEGIKNLKKKRELAASNTDTVKKQKRNT